jgi:hypothetical protein
MLGDRTIRGCFPRKNGTDPNVSRLRISGLGAYGPQAMPTSEQYRQKAEECRRLAGEVQEQLERDALLRMSAQWDRLADHKLRQETKDGH